MFREMDTDGSNAVSGLEILKFLKEKPSPLALELFKFLDDFSESNEWDFSQFMHAICTMCMFGRNELLHFW